MNRMFTILLLATIFAFVACGSNEQKTDEISAEQTSQTELLEVSNNATELAETTETLDINSIINNIKKLYKEIKAKQKKLTMTKIDKSADESEDGPYYYSEYQIYKEQNDIKLIINIFARDLSEINTEVYFSEDKPFFVFVSDQYADDKPQETRYYLHNGKLVRCIEGKTTLKETSSEFQTAQSNVDSILEDISQNAK